MNDNQTQQIQCWIEDNSADAFDLCVDDLKRRAVKLSCLIG